MIQALKSLLGAPHGVIERFLVPLCTIIFSSRKTARWQIPEQVEMTRQAEQERCRYMKREGVVSGLGKAVKE